MPNYSYKGRNQSGSLVSGNVWAASAEAAATELFGSNITPIDISESARKEEKPVQGSSNSLTGAISDYFTGNRVDITELIIFSRQMYSMNKAGIPLDKALRGIESSLENLALKRVLKDIVNELEKGMALTDAMGKHPRYFSPLYLSLIHVGENTGRLDLAFLQVSKYLDLERDTRKQIRSAVRYPIFVLVAIAVALAVITMFVIPVFAQTFNQLGAELPWQTILLINISDFVVAYWPYILVFLFGSFFSFRYYVSTRKGRLNWDRRKMRLPLIGSIFERVALSRFARTFAMMMKAGVPIVQSLGVISKAVGNAYIGRNVKRMRDGISKGESVYATAVKAKMFSPLVLQMIAVGEESGNIDDLLEEVADFYDSEIEYDLKKLGAAIEPILIIFIAGMVLVLALGVFLPIWDLARAAG